MFKYRIITTCGISLRDNLNKKIRMSDTLLSSMFYELTHSGEDEKAALKRISNLLLNEDKNKMIGELKNIANNCYAEVREKINIESNLVKNEVETIVSKHINMKTLNKTYGFSFEIFKDNIIKSIYKDSSEFNQIIDNYLNLDLKRFIRDKSAECNAMVFYLDEHIGENSVKEKLDKIYLISSDTEEGYNTAEIIKKFLEVLIEEVYKGNSKDLISIYRINGLTTKNPIKFEKQGIKEYLSKLFDIRYEDKNHEYKYVINLTGGYKATIPYTIYFASGFDLDVFYIHERKDYGIVFPRIPIKFGQDMMNKLTEIKELLDKNKKRAAIKKAEQYNMKSFITKDGAFSEFGEVLIELIEKKIVNEEKLETKKGLLYKNKIFKK